MSYALPILPLGSRDTSKAVPIAIAYLSRSSGSMVNRLNAGGGQFTTLITLFTIRLMCNLSLGFSQIWLVFCWLQVTGDYGGRCRHLILMQF